MTDLWNTSLQLFDLNYKFELVGTSLLALAKSICYTFVWRQAYFPETSASELNPNETGWAQVEDLLVPAFMTLNSNPEALLAWFHVGAPLAAQLFSVHPGSHTPCVLGNVDALRSTLTAASNVVLTLYRL